MSVPHYSKSSTSRTRPSVQPRYTPRIYLDLQLDQRQLGRIYIKLFPESFPAGVENIYHLALGDSIKTISTGTPRHPSSRQIRRTLEGSIFYRCISGNYLQGGDLYQNRGTSAATIWDDQPIPSELGEWAYPMDRSYLLILVPHYDPETGDRYYDSTFAITLQPALGDNLVGSMEEDHVVIGHVYRGDGFLRQIDAAIKPKLHGRTPLIKISKSGVL